MLKRFLKSVKGKNHFICKNHFIFLILTSSIIYIGDSISIKKLCMQIYTFCDDDTEDDGLRHNPYSASMHNSRCNMRSAWSVMRDHADFACKLRYNYVLAGCNSIFRIFYILYSFSKHNMPVHSAGYSVGDIYTYIIYTHYT